MQGKFTTVCNDQISYRSSIWWCAYLLLYLIRLSCSYCMSIRPCCEHWADGYRDLLLQSLVVIKAQCTSGSQSLTQSEINPRWIVSCGRITSSCVADCLWNIPRCSSTGTMVTPQSHPLHRPPHQPLHHQSLFQKMMMTPQVSYEHVQSDHHIIVILLPTLWQEELFIGGVAKMFLAMTLLTVMIWIYCHHSGSVCRWHFIS